MLDTETSTIKTMKRFIAILILITAEVSIASAAPNYNKPDLTSTRENFPAEIRENVNSAIKIDPTTGSNIPSGAIWFDYANGLLKRYESAAWVAKTLATGSIADSAVTLSKIQNITSDRLLGRDTASSGAIEELTVGGGLEFTGSGGIQRAALTGNVTASAGSNSTTIAPGVVTESMLADDAASRSTMLGFYSIDSLTGTIGATDATIPQGLGQSKAYRMPKAGTVTHLSIECTTTISAGSITITLFENGSTTSKTLVASSGTGSSGSITAETFAAGNTLGLQFSTSSLTGGSTCLFVMWGHFTE